MESDTNRERSARDPKKFKQNKDKDSQRQKSSNRNYLMKKRDHPKPSQRKNDIFITTKSNFKAQVKQIKELLSDQYDEVLLHCLGNAISRGINLALIVLEESNGAFNYEANTSTVELIDDLHPLRDEDDFATQKRLNSALHIRIFKYLKSH